MPVAFNKKTGELRVLDQAGKWAAPTIAVNPQTGDRLYLDGEEWKPVPLTDDEEGAGLAASVIQGPLMGAGDELTAAVMNPISAAKAAFGAEDEKAGPYYQELRKFRGIENRYRVANPVKSFLATAGGGLAGGGLQLGRAAFGAAGRLVPNAGRVAQAGMTGAAFGGAAGFGSGEGGLADRLVNSAFGGGIGAATGVGAEVAVPALGRLVQAVRGNPRLWQNGVGLTPAGQQAAQAVGLDPAQASAALQREFAAQAQNALNPGQAAAVARARSLPVPVNLRRGQVTLIPDDQMFETQAAKDVYGQLAGETIRASDEAQQAALRGNVGAIAQRIGGGGVQELGQGVDVARRALVSAERGAKARVNNLYQAARGNNDQAFVLGRNVGEALATARQGLIDDGFSPVTAGRVHSILDRAANELRGVGQAVGREPQISVGNVFGIRQELSALSRSSDAVEATAAGRARRAIDGWLNTALDEDLISGEPGVVDLWRRAISARRDYARQFQAGDFVEKLVARRRDGSNELALDPQGAVNLIFGRSETGFTSQNGMVRGLMRLRAQLGENSQAWNSLREEAFLRLARAGEGATTPTGRDFSGANFAKAWETALAKSPGTMRLLFTEQERNLISQFAEVARRTTVNVRGGANYSNTSAGAVQAIRRLWLSAFMGPRMAAFLESVPIVRGLQNIGQEMRANRAVMMRLARGTRPQPTPRLNRAVEAVSGSAANAVVQSAFGDP